MLLECQLICNNFSFRYLVLTRKGYFIGSNYFCDENTFSPINFTLFFFPIIIESILDCGKGPISQNKALSKHFLWLMM